MGAASLMSTEMDNKSQKIMIAQPKEMPIALLSFLKEFFRDCSNVKEAYLAVIYYENINTPHRLIIAVNTDSNFDMLKDSLRDRLVKSGVSHEQFEFIEIATSPIASYFTKIKPFYTASHLC